MRRTDDATLAGAMFVLANDIQSEDGVANAAIREAGERIQQLVKERKEIIGFLRKMPAANLQITVGMDKLSYGNKARQLIAKLEAA
jgi:hypothetical protein